MMLRLYKFTCSPNYPVVSHATLVFAIKPHMGINAVMELAVTLATERGFSKAKGEASIEYLGTFMPHDEVLKLPYVIQAESGEY